MIVNDLIDLLITDSVDVYEAYHTESNMIEDYVDVDEFLAQYGDEEIESFEIGGGRKIIFNIR